MAELNGTITTMIGSLPFADVDAALDLLDKYPLSAPAWPQLPKRSFKESMTLQYSEGMPGLLIDETEKRVCVQRDDRLLEELAVCYENIMEECLDPFAVTAGNAAGLHGFLSRARANGGKLPLVKGQVCGAFTTGLSLSDNDCRAVWFDEQYRDVVIKVLALKARWMIRELQTVGDKVLLFYDEPIFSALGTPAYLGIQDEEIGTVLNELALAVHEESALMGVHCCGSMDWALLASTQIDIIAFDAYGYGDNLTLYPEAIAGFLQRGGSLAFGIVPTADDSLAVKENASVLAKKVDELIEVLEGKGVPRDLVRNRLILTPSCGMGNLTPASAEAVLKNLSELGTLMG